MKINILGNRILVEDLQKEMITTGGIFHFVDDEEFQKMVVKSKVLSVGEKVKGVNIGDYIHFKVISSTPLEFEGKTYLIVRDFDTLVVESQS